MFQALICPSSGVCDYVVELLHWLYCSWIGVCWSQGEDTTPAEPHPDSSTAIQEQYSQRGSSTTQSQTPEDGHINA